MDDRTPAKGRPKISLGMPLYNQFKFLPEALNSLLAQTYSDFQLIMVDDSTELVRVKSLNSSLPRTADYAISRMSHGKG